MKICIEPDCWNTTPNTRCVEHERVWQARRNRDPKRKPRRTAAYMGISLAGHVCACCGTNDDLTRHHVEPLARGTGTAIGPLVAMCRRCNSSIGVRVMADHRCPLHGGVSRG